MTAKQIRLSIKTKMSQAKKADVKISHAIIAARLNTRSGKPAKRQYVQSIINGYSASIDRLIEVSKAVDAIIADHRDSVNSIKINN